MSEKKQIIKDLTVGSVPKVLLTFSLPLFMSGLLQMVYNMVDMMVVGRFVGTEGLSAVAIGGEILQLITFVAMGFSNAGQILISRYVGENRRDKVGKMVGTLFTLLLSLAVLIMIVFLFSYKGIMAWLNTPEEIWEYTRQYSVTCIYGIIFIYGYNLVSAIMRGMGDSRHPFMFIAIASVINVVLDILFVGPLHMVLLARRWPPSSARLSALFSRYPFCIGTGSRSTLISSRSISEFPKRSLDRWCRWAFPW